MTERSQTMPIGVIVRRRPGVTRWERWHWRVVGILPGAPAAEWREIDRAGEAVDYHAGTLPLTLWRGEAEAYAVELAAPVPSVTVVLRPGEDRPAPFAVTASPYEAQDYTDNAEDIVERIEMPAGLAAWVRDFVARHHAPEPFVKRRRTGNGRPEPDGPQVRAPGDVWRTPGRKQ